MNSLFEAIFEGLSDAFFAYALALMLIHFGKREKYLASQFWLGCANTCAVLNEALQHTNWVYFNVACAVFAFHTWWKGGGGDNTKRRLKKWARRFSPVRRTAPVAT